MNNNTQATLPSTLPVGYLYRSANGNLRMWTGRDWKETQIEDLKRDSLRYTVEAIERERATGLGNE